MRGAAGRIAARAGGEETGFTLPEVLVAMVIGMVVLGAAVILFTSSIRGQPALQTRDTQIQQARTAVEQIVREVHQASVVKTATGSQLSLITWVDTTCAGGASSTAVTCRVTYTCVTTGACTRTLANPDGTGGGAAVQIVNGLSASPTDVGSVFSYTPNTTLPTYIGVRLAFAPKPGQNGVTLDDGASLSNAPPPPSSA